MPPRALSLAAALTALASPVGGVAAQAQPAAAAAPAAVEHVLEIRDGRMFLDGHPLPPRNLPDGLDLDGLPETTVNFVGPVRPVLEIDGVVYVLDGEQFKLLSETDRAESRVFFIPTEPGSPEPAARAADAPLMEASEEAYLRQVAARDHALYEQIEQEHAIENETLRLAARIRSTADPAERARLMQSLRQKLEASFELKQEIRAGEIAQAEDQLEELRRLLSDRASRKDQIIDRRMQELVGAH
jgi:hypothetical protein